MNPLEALEAELKEYRSKRKTAYRTIEFCNTKIDDLEEAIEHLKILPRYQEEASEDE